MDEDEDDLHRKGLHHWPSSHVQIKPSETAGRPPASPSVMLPCPVHVEHRRFLYGNAGLLLLASLGRSRPPDVVLQQNLRVMDPAESVETLIGQKLQLIGDQFYQEHMMGFVLSPLQFSLNTTTAKLCKSACHIIGGELPSLQDISPRRCLRKAQRIISDSSHPS
ncbi:uncharacterized protein LOC113117824 isoform X1 [Carassius auratus]|uniref:Uncharacterized protein LOC113117824 isoform X1 n=1 Tax=Carassius auratus TaxID=7957 RepID=A0A6P6R9W7_CARAU|nr:uncharacterized protein LOC113117824 isoform X1 [Carassius auratus]